MLAETGVTGGGVTVLAETGVTGGGEDGAFPPLASVDRDVMSAYLYRLPAHISQW